MGQRATAMILLAVLIFACSWRFDHVTWANQNVLILDRWTGEISIPRFLADGLQGAKKDAFGRPIGRILDWAVILAGAALLMIMARGERRPQSLSRMPVKQDSDGLSADEGPPPLPRDRRNRVVRWLMP